MSFVVRALGLTVLWLLAWGQLSVSFVLSGLAVSIALLVVFPARRRSSGNLHFSPFGAVRLAGYIAVQLVVSTVLVAREIVSRRSRVHVGVLAHDMEHPSDEVVTVMSSLIALSPGTMTVEATPSRIYVHFLLLHDLDRARRDLRRLERLTARALGAAAPGGSP